MYTPSARKRARIFCVPARFVLKRQRSVGLKSVVDLCAPGQWMESSSVDLFLFFARADSWTTVVSTKPDKTISLSGNLSRLMEHTHSRTSESGASLRL